MRRYSLFSLLHATAWTKGSPQIFGRQPQILRTALCLSLALTGLGATGVAVRAGGTPPKGSGGGGPVSTYAYITLYVDSAAAGSQAAASLSGATVTANGTSVATSGGSNQFSISTTPGASVNVTVTCAGYATQTMAVTAGPAYSTTTKTVYMVSTAPVTYPYAGVSGTVNDTVDAVAPATSAPIPNATVYLTVNGVAAGSSTTDANGNYSITASGGLPAGAALSISTSAYGYNNGSLSTTESGTASASGAYYPLGTTTAAPNNQAVFFNGSMSYIYGCNYPSWEYADFAPHYLAYWPPPLTDQDGYNYDTGNTETDSASPYNGQLVSIQSNFANMGALAPVNNSTPMRTVRWFLFSQMAYTLKWTGESSAVGSNSTSSNAKVATTGANQNTINPATGTKDPLLAGITKSGLDYTTFTEIGLALKYAAQNNIRILFTFCTFYDLEGNSGNHRAVATTTQSGISPGSAVQDSYVNNALIPALKYITAWENANAGTYPKAKNVVFAYDVLNEPDQDMYGTINGNTLTGTYQNGDTGTDSGALLSIADVQAFITRCAAAVHTYGGGALATGDTSQPQVAGLLQGCGLDFYCAHYYGYWNDATSSDANGYPTAWSLGIGLPAANTIGNGGGSLDKPCVIEEMQTSEQTTDTDGSGNHLTANWILDRVHALGYAGALGWGYTLSYAGDDEGDSLPGYTQATDPLSHWSYFEPFFTAWPGNNVYNPATGSGVVIGPN